MNTKRVEQLNHFLEQNPNDSFIKFALALEYINDGDDKTGLMHFTDILQHNPDYTGLYYHMGKLYERMNKKDLAVQTYEEGIKRTLGKDQHAHHELQEALNQLMLGEEE